MKEKNSLKNLKICVVGLGLIGGSVCLSLKRAGYRADGLNRSRRALEYALSNGVCDGEAKSVCDYDVVFIALPPEACSNFIATADFKTGAVVADLCGVKRLIEVAAEIRSDIRYVGAHPMAGKEVSGVENACADLFDGASMVITHGDNTDPDALNTVKRLTFDMGFKYLVECSAELHDRKIAYTSQLAHVVSNAYVNDPEIGGCLGFTGGSFQDMTRIAGVDENMWAALYLANADNLLEKVENLTESLSQFKSALSSAKETGEISSLVQFLSKGAMAYRAGKAEDFYGEGISVTVLR